MCLSFDEIAGADRYYIRIEDDSGLEILPETELTPGNSVKTGATYEVQFNTRLIGRPLADGDYSVYVLAKDVRGTPGPELEVPFSVVSILQLKPGRKISKKLIGWIVVVVTGLALIAGAIRIYYLNSPAKKAGAPAALAGAAAISGGTNTAAVPSIMPNPTNLEQALTFLSQIVATNQMNDGQYRRLAIDATLKAQKAQEYMVELQRMLSTLPMSELTNLNNKLATNGSLFIVHGNMTGNFMVGNGNSIGTQNISFGSSPPMSKMKSEPLPQLPPPVMKQSMVVNMTSTSVVSSASAATTTNTIMVPVSPTITNGSPQASVERERQPSFVLPVFYMYAFPACAYEERTFTIWPFRCRHQYRWL